MHICRENETTWIRSGISLICMRDTQNRRGIAVLRAHWWNYSFVRASPDLPFK